MKADRKSYKELIEILDNVIKASESAKRECQKDTPDSTKVCQLAYENLDGLLAQIESCVFSKSFNMM